MKTVNLLQFFPWAFIMHLVRALIVFNISNTILKNKYNTAVTLASIVGFGMIYSGVSLLFVDRKNELIFMFGYYLMMFCILLAVTRGTIFFKIFCSRFQPYSISFFIFYVFGCFQSFIRHWFGKRF